MVESCTVPYGARELLAAQASPRDTLMPALLVVGLWIVLQVFAHVGTAAGQTTGVAYMAHIGGSSLGSCW